MEFKNLAEVTKLEEVPEGASVLAATAEGEVVRVPGDGLGGSGGVIAFFDVEFDPYGDGVILSCPSFAEVDALAKSAQFLVAVLKTETHGAVSSTYLPLVFFEGGSVYAFAGSNTGELAITPEGEPSFTQPS